MQNSNYPVIASVSIATDKEGRFNLNSLHKASGLGLTKAPSQWIVNKNTQELISELVKNKTMENPIVSSEGRNGGTFAHELLAVSYAGWISPKFQLMVNQVFIDYRNGKLETKPKKSIKVDNSGLTEYRKAKAIAMATTSAEVFCSRFCNLSLPAQQVIFANIINNTANDNIIPLPILTEKTYSASEVGERFGISSKKVGQIANKLNIKNDEYGIIVLDKSPYSNKQVETFRYNERAITLIESELIH